jgi:hypothetical protein
MTARNGGQLLPRGKTGPGSEGLNSPLGLCFLDRDIRTGLQ